jgi:four helix bundle protein
MTRPELEQRSAGFARDAFKFVWRGTGAPRRTKIRGQLQKASSAMAANYRASGRARSRKEFVAKIGVVNEEADEAVFWLEYIRDTDLSSEPQLLTLYDEAKELRAIFAASHRTARENLGRDDH